MFLAGSSLVGLGSLAYYGLGFSNQAGILEKLINSITIWIIHKKY